MARLGEKPTKGGEVAVLVKDGTPGVASIEDVIAEPALGSPGTARGRAAAGAKENSRCAGFLLKEKRLPTLFLPQAVRGASCFATSCLTSATGQFTLCPFSSSSGYDDDEE